MQSIGRSNRLKRKGESEHFLEIARHDMHVRQSFDESGKLAKPIDPNQYPNCNGNCLNHYHQDGLIADGEEFLHRSLNP